MLLIARLHNSEAGETGCGTKVPVAELGFLRSRLDKVNVLFSGSLPARGSLKGHCSLA